MSASSQAIRRAERPSNRQNATTGIRCCTRTGKKKTASTIAIRARLSSTAGGLASSRLRRAGNAATAATRAAETPAPTRPTSLPDRLGRTAAQQTLALKTERPRTVSRNSKAGIILARAAEGRSRTALILLPATGARRPGRQSDSAHT